MDFSGRIRSYAVPDLLQWVKTDRRSGALTVRRDRRRKRLLFRDGDLTACVSNDVCDYYGQYLLLHGYIDQGQLFASLAHCRTRGTRLGQALADLAVLPEEVVARTLKEQICDSVCDLILWSDGVFSFTAGSWPPQEEILPEPIDLTQLVLEGALWLDERARFRKLLPHDDVELHRGSAWPGRQLAPLQARLAGLLGPPLTLRQALQRARAVRFRCLEAVVALLDERVARVEARLPARREEAASGDVYELLLEEATAAAGSLLAGDRLVLPVDWLGRMFPVWIHMPPPSEMAKLSAALRFFWNQLDGTTPLHALLAEAADTRRQQLDLLLLEVRRRNVVLLPLRAAELAARIDAAAPFAVWWAAKAEGGTRRESAAGATG